MVAPAAFTRRAMRMRFSPSTEQGPAMTWKCSPPIFTPCPQSTTVSMGWNLRFAFLKGSETRWTRSTMSMDSSRNGSMRVVSPTRPTMSSFSPWLTCACSPFFSIQDRRWSTAARLASFFKIAIMRHRCFLLMACCVGSLYTMGRTHDRVHAAVYHAGTKPPYGSARRRSNVILRPASPRRPPPLTLRAAPLVESLMRARGALAYSRGCEMPGCMLHADGIAWGILRRPGS